MQTRHLVVLLASAAALSTPAMGDQEGHSAGPSGSGDVQTVTAWLSSHAVPLKTLEPGNGFDDLKPLAAALREARIVALGEATHGTHEFFRFKHRMLEFLVREMGFNTFAMEASYSACLKIDEYVVYGKGDRRAVLTGQGFWTWDTKEVADLIDWMRAYNRELPVEKRVRFVGFDTQHVEPAIEAVRNYLSQLAPSSSKQFESTFASLALSPAAISQQRDEEKARVRESLLQMLGVIGFNRNPFARATSTQGYESVLAQARTLLQFYETYSRSSVNPYVVTPPAEDASHAAESGAAVRDRLMADNVASIVDASPSARIVIWAHNTHISTERHTYSGWRNYQPMGSHLRQLFGDRYYSVGLLFDQGSFQARDTGRDPPASTPVEFTLPKAAAGSIEWYLAHVSAPNYFVDLRSVPPDGQVATWLRSSHIMRNIGGGFSSQWSAEYLIPTVIAEHFDGLVFVARTTRAQPNAGGLADPPK